MSQPTTVPDLTKFNNYGLWRGSWIEYLHLPSRKWHQHGASRRVDSNIIFAPKAKRGPQDDSRNGHATCVASKAGGVTYGVAKAATLIAVKTSFEFSDLLVVFDMVRRNIKKRKIQERAVVNVSRGRKPAEDGRVPDYWVRASKAMRKIMLELDVPIVSSAGNDAVLRSPQIDKYPSVWSTDDWPLTNVGSVNFNGFSAVDSQSGPLRAVSAPGVGVTCSTPTGTGSRLGTGTSYAAPQVAGLLAYFLGQPKVPFDTSNGNVALNALNFVKNTASWPRQKVPSAVNVAWNLIDDKQNPPSS